MAIDTKEKRFSMMGFGTPSIKHVIPQGSLGKSGRATLMDLYSGIPLSSPPIGGNTLATYLGVMFTRHRRR